MNHPRELLVNRLGHDAGLADLYAGSTCWLLGGGPSSRQQPLERLNHRGVCIFAINNAPAGLPPSVRPHLWVHGDPSGKFSDQIWRDPSILKFCPVGRWRSRGSDEQPEKHRGIRTRAADGSLVLIDRLRACDCPGVFGFQRNRCFEPDSFLWESTVNDGNHGAAINPRWPDVISTFFAALRLAFYLGFAKVNLLGVDFRMNADRPYSFNQWKSAAGVSGQNEAFAKQCAMLDALAPRMLAAGCRVVNCSPDSRLWSFPRQTFDDALGECLAGFDYSINASGYYD